ncbi:GntR family transcriptional regulator [Spirochaetota bacterium]
MGVLIALNNSSGVPYYKQIVNQITYGVINSILKPGEQLPTVRQLAVDMQVNLNTIVKAYNELEIKGIVSTQQGTGTFITYKVPKFDRKEKDKTLKSICTLFLNEITSYGVTFDEAFEMLQIIREERESKAKPKAKEKNNE